MLFLYALTLSVSAALVFSIQPMFTKMVLPRLGGSPAVWSVAMVFFQSLLLGGYAVSQSPALTNRRWWSWLPLTLENFRR